jgi:biotin synthase-related radical SAM superfamily protein
LHVVKRIRASTGTAGALGLIRLHSNAEPTTAYVMTYTNGSCRANCSFCPQARESSSNKEMLSRVAWPDFSFEAFMERVILGIREGKISRICIQALNYPDFVEDIFQICSTILCMTSIPISVSCPPMTKTQMERLKLLGVDRIGIPIDGATPEVFEKVKGAAAGGPYRWESHLLALARAVEVFGRDRVSTHLIVGLGETEREIVEVIEKLSSMGVNPSLFALTPVKGTKLEASRPPDIGQYRRVQVARYLIMRGLSSSQLMRFDGAGKIIDFGASTEVLNQTLSLGNPFKTLGCPSCNRPYYTESPRGPIYNYPRDLNESERKKSLQEMATGS